MDRYQKEADRFLDREDPAGPVWKLAGDGVVRDDDPFGDAIDALQDQMNAVGDEGEELARQVGEFDSDLADLQESVALAFLPREEAQREIEAMRNRLPVDAPMGLDEAIGILRGEFKGASYLGDGLDEAMAGMRRVPAGAASMLKKAEKIHVRNSDELREPYPGDWVFQQYGTRAKAKIRTVGPEGVQLDSTEHGRIDLSWDQLYDKYELESDWSQRQAMLKRAVDEGADSAHSSETEQPEDIFGDDKPKMTKTSQDAIRLPSGLPATGDERPIEDIFPEMGNQPDRVPASAGAEGHVPGVGVSGRAEMVPGRDLGDAWAGCIGPCPPGAGESHYSNPPEILSPDSPYYHPAIPARQIDVGGQGPGDDPDFEQDFAEGDLTPDSDGTQPNDWTCAPAVINYALEQVDADNIPEFDDLVQMTGASPDQGVDPDVIEDVLSQFVESYPVTSLEEAQEAVLDGNPVIVAVTDIEEVPSYDEEEGADSAQSAETEQSDDIFGDQKLTKTSQDVMTDMANIPSVSEQAQRNYSATTGLPVDDRPIEDFFPEMGNQPDRVPPPINTTGEPGAGAVKESARLMNVTLASGRDSLGEDAGAMPWFALGVADRDIDQDAWNYLAIALEDLVGPRVSLHTTGLTIEFDGAELTPQLQDTIVRRARELGFKVRPASETGGMANGTGHYVVLTDYDADAGEFHGWDPASGDFDIDDKGLEAVWVMKTQDGPTVGWGLAVGSPPEAAEGPGDENDQKPDPENHGGQGKSHWTQEDTNDMFRATPVGQAEDQYLSDFINQQSNSPVPGPSKSVPPPDYWKDEYKPGGQGQVKESYFNHDMAGVPRFEVGDYARITREGMGYLGEVGRVVKIRRAGDIFDYSLKLNRNNMIVDVREDEMSLVREVNRKRAIENDQGPMPEDQGQAKTSAWRKFAQGGPALLPTADDWAQDRDSASIQAGHYMRDQNIADGAPAPVEKAMDWAYEHAIEPVLGPPGRGPRGGPGQFVNDSWVPDPKQAPGTAEGGAVGHVIGEGLDYGKTSMRKQANSKALGELYAQAAQKAFDDGIDAGDQDQLVQWIQANCSYDPDNEFFLVLGIGSALADLQSQSKGYKHQVDEAYSKAVQKYPPKDNGGWGRAKTSGFVSRSNLTAATKQALGNAQYFGRPYYIITTTAGLYVERDAPANADLLVRTVYPDGRVEDAPRMNKNEPFQTKMMPMQPYTEDEHKRVRKMVSDAASAGEHFSEDELEEHARKQKKTSNYFVPDRVRDQVTVARRNGNTVGATMDIEAAKVMAAQDAEYRPDAIYTFTHVRQTKQGSRVHHYEFEPMTGVMKTAGSSDQDMSSGESNFFSDEAIPDSTGINPGNTIQRDTSGLRTTDGGNPSELAQNPDDHIFDDDTDLFDDNVMMPDQGYGMPGSDEGVRIIIMQPQMEPTMTIPDVPELMPDLPGMGENPPQTEDPINALHEMVSDWESDKEDVEDAIKELKDQVDDLVDEAEGRGFDIHSSDEIEDSLDMSNSGNDQLPAEPPMDVPASPAKRGLTPEQMNEVKPPTITQRGQ